MEVLFDFPRYAFQGLVDRVNQSLSAFHYAGSDVEVIDLSGDGLECKDQWFKWDFWS